VLASITSYPHLVFAASFIALWLAAVCGRLLRRRMQAADEDLRDDFSVILAATLTLLGLIVGFSFSMATSRYDLRKTYEEAEANAIGTAYVRAGLLPATDSARLRSLLRDYLDQRILFYVAEDEKQLEATNMRTSRLQAELWSLVEAQGAAQPTPIMALVVSGINDVLNSQGYTQAAYWNRIPPAAWSLMAAIAVCCNLLLGFGSRSTKAAGRLLFVLPVVVAVAFMLIADIDTPRHGVIRVVPQNLNSLAQSFHAN
jgi:protein-S-isoprenylcysteine O-methyltransferase Ste14